MRGVDKKYTEQIQAFAIWLNTPLSERTIKNQTEFGKKYGVSNVILARWKKKLSEEPFDEVDAFKKKVYADAMSPSASARDKEIYARIAGLFVDKSEIKHEFKLTADDYFRIREEAASRLRENGSGADRIRGLLAESTVLPEEVCVDSEQEYSQDS